MSKPQIFVQQADGTAREVEIASGGVLLLNADEHLFIAASSDQAEVETGAPGEVIIKLEGVGEFTVESAQEIPEQIAQAPEIMGIKPLPTIVFEPTRTDLSDDAPTHESLGVHQARVDSTAFLDRQTGDDFGMGQLLDMAKFSGMAGKGLAGREGADDTDEDDMLADSLDDGLSGDPGQDYLNFPPVIDLNTTLLVDDDEAGNLLGHLRATDRESGPEDLKFRISQGPAYGTLYIGGKEVDATKVTFTQADLDSGRVTFRFDPHAQNKVLVIEDDTFIFRVSDGTHTTGPATFHIQNTTVQVWGTDDNDDLTKAKVDFNRDGSKFHVYGFKGDDTLRGGLGADTLEGGEGQDCADYSDSKDWVNVDLTKGATAQSGGGERNHAADDVLIGIEDVLGSRFKDVIKGDDKSNRLWGGDDDDTLYGGYGNDTLYGGTGNDSLVDVGIRNSRGLLDGGDGDDTLLGSLGRDTLYGGVGHDLLMGEDIVIDPRQQLGTNDDLYGDAGNDTLLSYGGSDTLHGGDENDFLDGGLHSDHLYGGNGDDTLLGGIGIHAKSDGQSFIVDCDLLEGGAGNDILDGGASKDTLYGGDGNDSLYGGTFAQYQQYPAWDGADDDLLYGGVGEDTLDGGIDGNDSLYGEDGDDSLYGGDPVIRDFTTWRVSSDDLLDGGAGNDTLDGGTGNDTLIGGDGHDSLDGGDGDDTLYGGWVRITNYFTHDNNTLNGGAGNDFLSVEFAHRDTRNSLDGGEGDDTLVGGVGIDTLDGGVGNDVLVGDINEFHHVYGNNDVLNGGAGNDTLFGLGGLDSLVGGVGNDSMDGGFADDTLIGDDGDDILLGGRGVGTSPAYKNLTDRDFLDGGAGNDTLDGGTSKDTLYGGDGNDSLYGGVFSAYQPYPVWDSADDDLLYGGAGDDTMDGGVGNDFLDGGFDNDFIRGGDGNDTLMGGAGKDTLQGGAGNDLIHAGDGDTVDGGGGYDVLASEDAFLDVVTFTTIAGIDRIDLTGASEGLAVSVDAILRNGVADSNGVMALFVTGDAHDWVARQADAGWTWTQAEVTIDEKTYVLYEAAKDGQTVRLYVESGLEVVDGTLQILGTAGSDDLTTAGDFDNPRYAFEVYGLGGKDTLTGGVRADTLDGGAGNDFLFGDTGKDFLNGGDGQDFLNGGLGHDILHGGGGNDRLYGGFGNDTLDGGFDNDFIRGGDGDDALHGGGGIDSLFGDVGNDILHLDLTTVGLLDSSETILPTHIGMLDGGTGTDTLVLDSHAGSGATLDLSSLVTAGKITGIEHVDITGDTDDANTLTLTASDVLGTTGGTDTLWVRGDGNDTVTTTDTGWTHVGVETGADGQQYNHYSGYAGSTLVNLMINADLANQNVVHA
ncbi:cadherin-like domain-containing protein [Desulfomicrobium sp. ZS1]|uniref:cadherin-like domain-containing protein n=1 Tax=Desulfomicrobium sp. ZS1 TaxID=2952228 RepID=UPI00273A5FFB|nr:cadherin-like domain-containing protein [Desulfomicrobium sp. ZS1]